MVEGIACRAPHKIMSCSSKSDARILTAKERRRIHAYIDTNGERTSAIRTIVTRANQVLPSIEKDLQLLKQLLEHYKATKAKPR